MQTRNTGARPHPAIHAHRLRCECAGAGIGRRRVSAAAVQREGSTLSDTDSGAFVQLSWEPCACIRHAICLHPLCLLQEVFLPFPLRCSCESDLRLLQMHGPSRVPSSRLGRWPQACTCTAMQRCWAATGTANGRGSDRAPEHGEEVEPPEDTASEPGDDGWLEGSAITGNELTMCGIDQPTATVITLTAQAAASLVSSQCRQWSDTDVAIHKFAFMRSLWTSTMK